MDLNFIASVLFTFHLLCFVCGAASGVEELNGHDDGFLRLVYSREFLLSLGNKDHTTLPTNLSADIPLKTDKEKKIKKRGSRGGVKKRMKRRGFRTPLPVLTLSNPRTF